MITLFTIAGREAPIHALPNRPRFMLAADLARVYCTTPKRIGQAIKRNPDRFPDDFCFRLTKAEEELMWSRIVTTSARKRDDVRSLAFTHGGANALSGALKSPTAAAVSVEIHRAFAAMEARAMAEAKFLLAKLRLDTRAQKPIYNRICLGMEQRWSLDQLWRTSSYPKHKLEQAARELLAMGMIEQPPAGMQSDLFQTAG